ncbi:hypothetical protein AURANDRAFT_30956, partial [Aureococcus anophagefferens]
MATQHMKVRTAFRALDRDSSGTLEKDELLSLLENYHIKLSEADMDRLMAMIDTDGSGKISYREFNDYFGADIAVARRLGGKYKSACAAFRNIDMDKGGCLDKSELRDFIKTLNVELVEEDYEMLYRELDCDNSGSINYEEFL